jgi:hypothetical protein
MMLLFRRFTANRKHFRLRINVGIGISLRIFCELPLHRDKQGVESTKSLGLVA